MEAKAKKCKGVGKALGHGCGQLSYNRKFGLCLDGNKCFYKWLYSTEEGSEVVKSYAIKAKKEVNQASKKEKRQRINTMREESKSIAKLLSETKALFQKLIRIRDFGKNCVCCGEYLGDSRGAFDAGHYLKAELYSGLIFHPDNVNGQRKFCNQHLNGNEAEYSINLPKRIGQERFEWLINNRFRLKDYKYHRTELNEIKAFYTLELKQVEKGLKNIEDVDFIEPIKNIIK